jgi:hypothetical protein
MKDGIPSAHTRLDGLRRFIDLLTYAAEIGAVGKRPEVTEWEGVNVGIIL